MRYMGFWGLALGAAPLGLDELGPHGVGINIGAVGGEVVGVGGVQALQDRADQVGEEGQPHNVNQGIVSQTGRQGRRDVVGSRDVGDGAVGPVVTAKAIVVLGDVAGSQGGVISRDGGLVLGTLLEGGLVQTSKNALGDLEWDGGVDKVVVEGADNVGVVNGEGSLVDIEALRARVNIDNGGVLLGRVGNQGQDLVGKQVNQRAGVGDGVAAEVVVLGGAAQSVAQVQGSSGVGDLLGDLAAAPGVEALLGVSQGVGLVGVDVGVEVTAGDGQVLANTFGLDAALAVMDTLDGHPADGLHETTGRETIGTSIVTDEIANVQVTTKEQDGLGRVYGADGVDDSQGLGPADGGVSDNEIHVNVFLERLLEPGQSDGDVGFLEDNIAASTDKVVEETVGHDTGTELHAELVVELADGDGLVGGSIANEGVGGEVASSPLGSKSLMDNMRRHKKGSASRETFFFLSQAILSSYLVGALSNRVNV